MNAIIPADAVALAEAHVLSLEKRFPEMGYRAVHRVNLVMCLMSRLVWYGEYPTNALKKALDDEFREAMVDLNKWWHSSGGPEELMRHEAENRRDRKSTRLNSSHTQIS